MKTQLAITGGNMEQAAYFFEDYLKRYRRFIVFTWHVFAVSAANTAAFYLRFEGDIPSDFMRVLPYSILIMLAVRLPIFRVAGLDRGLWRYAGIADIQMILLSVTGGTALFAILVLWVAKLRPFPRSVLVIDWLLIVCMACGVRLAIRWYRCRRLSDARKGTKTLVIGAGNAGELIVRDMKNSHSGSYDPIGFVDDDENKMGLTIHGVPILGSMRDIPWIIKKYQPEEVLLAMPSAKPCTIKNLMEDLSKYKIPIRTLPRLMDILEGKVSVSQIRHLNLEDLLTRLPVSHGDGKLAEFIQGKVIMVTGAGGSIGSEICRQASAYGAKSIVAYERHENSLYNLDMEFKRSVPGSALCPVVGDINDIQRLRETLGGSMPDIIFHAAAHKHVPMMEQNPREAIKNNIIGTRRLASTAAEYGVGSFVLISTDKAVNPTSVMGASKRACELMLSALGHSARPRYITVRFGNVLGSSGSVVPLFREQINTGGPVTVTHPEMERFLMLIPEAVQLVLQAASIGKGGEIFVLDMGEPIKIADLARNLIMLSGYEPDKDIEIKYVGLRPGEKLYEELFDKGEVVSQTAADKIFRAVSSDVPDAETVEQTGDEFERLLEEGNTADIMKLLNEFVKTCRLDQGTVCASPQNEQSGQELFTKQPDITMFKGAA